MAPEGTSEHKCRMVWLYWYEVIDGINGINGIYIGAINGDK